MEEGWRVLLDSSGQRPGMLPITLQSVGNLKSKHLLLAVRAADSAENEKPCSPLAFLISLLNTPNSFLEYYALPADNHGISGRQSTSLSIWV